MTLQALVVEDDAATYPMYEQILLSMGFTSILRAVDGDEALDLLTEHTPEVVLLDLLLPTVSGLEVLDFIHSQPHLQGTSTIVITAHQEYRGKTPLAPQDEYLVKPIRMNMLRDAVERVTARFRS